MNANLKNGLMALCIAGAGAGVIAGIGYGIEKKAPDIGIFGTTNPDDVDDALQMDSDWSSTKFHVEQNMQAEISEADKQKKVLREQLAKYASEHPEERALVVQLDSGLIDNSLNYKFVRDRLDSLKKKAAEEQVAKVN